MSNPAGITAGPRCAYCGKRSCATTCAEHRDLPALDPDWARFTLDRRLEATVQRGTRSGYRQART